MTTSISKPFLGWRDFCQLFGCGRSKALLLMQAIGVVYVGRSMLVRREALDDYLTIHNEIRVKWPTRRMKVRR
jgi:hypothetical protein